MASLYHSATISHQASATNSGSVDDCERRKRKRTRNPENWKKEKRKKAILSGQAYINTKGELVGPRGIGPNCNCKHKCFQYISEEQRTIIFKGFYSLKSYDEQNAYLYGLIRRFDILRKRKPISDRRTCSYRYYVRLKGKELQVCKKAFANIHGISDKKIRTLCIKHEQNVLFPRDNRGRHTNRPKKVTSELVTLIKQHILRMLSGPSGNNFVKKVKNQAPDVNISQLYKDFLKQYEVDAFDEETSKIRKNFDAKVKSWLYFKVFHEEFNSLDFNTVKRKLSDLRKSLEPSGSANKPKKRITKKMKVKLKETLDSQEGSNPENNHPFQPQIPTSTCHSTMTPHMGYTNAQQQPFAPNLQLGMFSLQHLNSASQTPTAFPSSSQQQQPLNLQSATSEQSPSQPLSLNFHPMGSHVSSYYLCFGHVPNLISLPVSSCANQSTSSTTSQAGTYVHQNNIHNYTSGNTLPHSPFASQTNVGASTQHPNILQSYHSTQHSNLYGNLDTRGNVL